MSKYEEHSSFKEESNDNSLSERESLEQVMESEKKEITDQLIEMGFTKEQLEDMFDIWLSPHKERSDI